MKAIVIFGLVHAALGAVVIPFALSFTRSSSQGLDSRDSLRRNEKIEHSFNNLEITRESNMSRSLQTFDANKTVNILESVKRRMPRAHRFHRRQNIKLVSNVNSSSIFRGSQTNSFANKSRHLNGHRTRKHAFPTITLRYELPTYNSTIPRFESHFDDESEDLKEDEDSAGYSDNVQSGNEASNGAESYWSSIINRNAVSNEHGRAAVLDSHSSNQGYSEQSTNAEQISKSMPYSSNSEHTSHSIAQGSEAVHNSHARHQDNSEQPKNSGPFSKRIPHSGNDEHSSPRTDHMYRNETNWTSHSGRDNTTQLSIMVIKIAKLEDVVTMAAVPCDSVIEWMPSVVRRLEFEIPGFYFYCIDTSEKGRLEELKAAYGDTCVDYARARVNDVKYAIPEGIDLVVSWRGMRDWGITSSWKFLRALQEKHVRLGLLSSDRESHNENVIGSALNLRRSPLLLSQPSRIINNVSLDEQTQLLLYSMDQLRRGF